MLLYQPNTFCRKRLTDVRTDDDADDDAGRRTVSDHNSSPRTSCLVELITTLYFQQRYNIVDLMNVGM